jgi:hypothetical protein
VVLRLSESVGLPHYGVSFLRGGGVLYGMGGKAFQKFTYYIHTSRSSVLSTLGDLCANTSSVIMGGGGWYYVPKVSRRTCLLLISSCRRL